MILKMMAVGPVAANCYIVGSEKTRQGIVIDPGDDGDRIVAEIKKMGLTITSIVATHGHFDHVGAIKEVKDATKAAFAIHTDDAEAARQSSEMVASMFGVKVEAPPEPDRLLKEGDVIEVGEYSFKVLHTAGHSQGGICLVGHGIVFTGDTLFNLGIGRTDFPGGDYDQLIGNIKKKLMTLPDETVVFSGHGPKSTIGAERRMNSFLT